MSTNGYTTADELLSLAGKRIYKDVTYPNPYVAGGVLKFRLRSLTEAEWSEISSSNSDRS